MTRSGETIWCDGCGAEILWIPYLVKGEDFCCQDCANGMICNCGDNLEWDDEYRDTTNLMTKVPPGI